MSVLFIQEHGRKQNLICFDIETTETIIKGNLNIGLQMQFQYLYHQKITLQNCVKTMSFLVISISVLKIKKIK